MRYLLAAFTLPLALVSSACYEYRAATSLAPLAGHRVQLLLTDSGSVVLAARIGPSVDAIEGTYLGDSAGSHLLRMTTSRARNGVETDWRGEQVVVPHALVASMLERRFSGSRTAFAAGLAAVGLGAMTAALRGTGEGAGGGPVITPPTPK